MDKIRLPGYDSDDMWPLVEINQDYLGIMSQSDFYKDAKLEAVDTGNSTYYIKYNQGFHYLYYCSKGGEYAKDGTCSSPAWPLATVTPE